MSTKKQSNISEPTTQPQRQKRFVRRNSIHTIHCRSGSLNKLAGLAEDLEDQVKNVQVHQESVAKPRKQVCNSNTMQLLNQFGSEDLRGEKRGSGSMRVKACCQDRIQLLQQYQKLQRKFQQRGERLQVLEEECRKMSRLANQCRQRCQNLQEELRLKKLQGKRMQKRAEKFKCESEKFQQERELMLKHIQQLERKSFGQQLLAMQSYREKALENEVSKVKQLLATDRSIREKELLIEVEKLSDQKYNLEQLQHRSKISTNMLLKQLEESEQYCEQIRQSASKAVTSSAQYIELRQRYKAILLQMRDMRREIMHLEQGRQFSSTVLQLSESMIVPHQQ